MSSSSFNPCRKRMYDVFISVEHRAAGSPLFTVLRSSLREAGFYVFEDNIKRRSGDVALLSGAIEGSRASIIFFSPNYGGSTQCLQELEKIMECRRSVDQLVVPVFYNVDPSDVRNQAGYFGKAFTASINEDKVLTYRTALQQAAAISPRFELMDLWYGRLVRDTVSDVCKLLDSRGLLVAKHPVGLQSHVQELIRMLNYSKSDDIQLLGIWGMGGIGKTTIAKAIYNQIGNNFENRKFVGPVFWDKNTSLTSFISKKKRSFVVFDDVRDFEKLNNLRERCGPGSRIIITTRDKRVLRFLGVDHIYRVNEMDYNECVELFSWHAFNKAIPERNFSGLVQNVVEYSDGLPLALVTLGSMLFERSKEEWESVLDSLKRSPIQDVQEVLKRSFDNLGSRHKQVFLVLAYLSYFFLGMDRNGIIQILKRLGSYPTLSIDALEEKSLVTFYKNKLQMHPLLREMGREVFKKESSINPKIYDVFLSFRGEDTRSKFTSHLHTSLENAGIYVFKDDDGLSRGEEISLSLLKAIRESKISIIILSTNYANSWWCLQELEDIMICYRTKAQKVLPVFYDVDPSEVRNQSGKFGQAFEDLIQRKTIKNEKEQTWRKALREVGCISGFVILNSRNESEDTKNIVEHVTRMLDMKDLFIANHPVGIESRVHEVVKLLESQHSKNPLILGIWGMGGVGKTTIAKAVYNKVCRKFQGRCFLLNIREVWDQDDGGVHLQEQLLSNVYKTTKIKIQNIEAGKLILKERLREKRILLVLDDVDKFEQLNALAASHEWFGPMSTIIITTRDKRLLSLLRVDKLYRMENLNEEESIELFSWHAFKEPCPREEFAQLSSEVISHCGRLPLALEVLGSHLFNREVIEWTSVLKKLKSIPDEQVQKKLKISFDGLSDDEYKEIFLDITFFFIGMERNDIIDILNGCGYPTEIGITILIEKSLIYVDTKNKIRMHDLLRDMGREIIRKISPKAPEERSRIWNPTEVCDLLLNNMGTKSIEGLALKLPRVNPIHLKAKAFKKMKRLKLLQLAGVQLDGDFKYLSTDLRWLYWHGCPSTYTTANFNQRNLVAIDLKYSNLQLMWKKSQLLKKLKILNLSHSRHLRETPDFTDLPNLEKLILKYCPSLSSISQTIGHLKQILVINLTSCTSLRVLPRSIYMLKSLKSLILSGCSNIDKLEEDLEQMESLTTLMADNTAITQVPHALIRSKSITYISLCGFEGLSRNVFLPIIWSLSSPTNNFSPQMQTYLDLSHLVSITVPNSNFQGTSSIINEIPRVRKRLRLECGSQVQRTVDDQAFNVTNCMDQLEAMATTSHVSQMDTSTSVDCSSQSDISVSNNLFNSILIQMGMSCPITETLRQRISQELCSSDSVVGESLLPSDNDRPDWSTFSSEGFSVIFDVPLLNGPNLKTMMLSIVYSSSSSPNIVVTLEGLVLKNLLIINYTKATTDIYKGDTLASLGDEDWQRVLSKLEPGDKVQVVVDLGHAFTVKKTTVFLIYEEPIN